MSRLFVFVRAITWASVFVGFVLVWIPARVVGRAGLVSPPMGLAQVLGMAVATCGAAVSVWCVLSFATWGQGTPAPFDPPRRLVVRGPYRFVRNPMYIGALLALAGAALFFGSWGLAAYAAALLGLAHVLVVSYEEPTLRATFGAEYEDYRRRVARWWPRR
jgi:protein-S-isoprenylcysteine O-methyltransferase Ste14